MCLELGAGTKNCVVCGKKFIKTSNVAKYCLECRENRYKNYYFDVQREKRMINNYGITMKDYKNLLSDQEGCCAVCGISEDELNKRLVIDHDHETGNVRGLLCPNCNVGIGMFQDDITLLRYVIEYYLI